MPESAFEYLSSHSLLFLATASTDGNVHVAPMFYATEGRGVFFSAPDGSETATNLKQNPTAAFAVADAPSDWGKARGLQVEGPVTEQDVSDLDAFTTYGDPEGTMLIGINVTPGSLIEGLDADGLEEALVANAVPDPEIFALDLQGRDLEGGFVFLEGSAAIGDNGGFVVGTVVASGPDSATRTVVVTAPAGFDDMEALLLEVVGTVTFTGVDTRGL